MVSHFVGAQLKEDHLSLLIGNFLCLVRIGSQPGGLPREKNHDGSKVGWNASSAALLRKHSVQIKRAPVCEECADRFGGTFPSLCLLFSHFVLSVILSVLN